MKVNNSTIIKKKEQSPLILTELIDHRKDRDAGNTDLGYTQQYSGLNRLTGNTIHKYKR